MNCLECVFCHESDCRRYPPDFNRGFPKVNGYLWCGEFKEIEKPEVKDIVLEPIVESQVPEVKRGWPKGKPRK